MVCWAVRQYNLVGRYRRFGGMPPPSLGIKCLGSGVGPWKSLASYRCGLGFETGSVMWDFVVAKVALG
jgi:hypothetical protein